MKKYILFDLDGTLTDPREGITSCVQYALKSFGIEEPDQEKLEPFIGPPLKDSFMEYYHMTEEEAECAVEKYSKICYNFLNLRSFHCFLFLSFCVLYFFCLGRFLAPCFLVFVFVLQFVGNFPRFRLSKTVIY